MAGFDLCEALRDDPSTTGSTAVVLSSESTASSTAQAFSLEVDDYIVKPLQPRELVSRSSTAIARRRQGMAAVYQSEDSLTHPEQ